MKQVNIEVKGVQFSNKGAELMLLAVIKMLENSSLNYTLTLSPGLNLPYLQRARLGAWQKLSFRRGHLDLTGLFSLFPTKLKLFLKQYGIITEDDIDIVFDLSGFAYGDQWGTKEIRNTKKQVMRFAKKNKLYIFFPQAFGPFKLRENKKNIFSIIENSSLLFARDKQSLNYLSDVLCSPKIKISPDFTCVVSPPKVEYVHLAKKGRRNVCVIPNSKLISKYNQEKESKDLTTLVEYYIEIINLFIKKGWHVTVLNHEGSDDLLICQSIMERMGVEGTLISEITAEGTKGLIKNMDAVVSSRYHGCITSLTQNIPCLATSWSHKYEQLFEDYNLSHNILNPNDKGKDLESRVNSFIMGLEEQRKQLAYTSESYNKSSLDMFELIEKKIIKHISKVE